MIPDWHLSILRCPRCKGLLAQRDDLLGCDLCAFSLRRNGDIWQDASISTSVDNPCGDIDYARRALMPFTSTAREEPQYRSHIQAAVQKWGPFSVAMDFGCGDGRFTQWLLSLGVEHVVAVDIDLFNLKRLEQKLGENERARTLLLNGDVFCLPVQRAAIDAVFAIGVLNLFGAQFEDVCGILREFLRPEGLLVNSEPTPEGSLLYALVRQDLNEFVQVSQTSTKTIDIESDQGPRVPVLGYERVAAMLEKSGFRLLETKGISVLPSLIFGGVLRMKSFSGEVKQQMVEVVDELASGHLPIYRVIIYLSQRS